MSGRYSLYGLTLESDIVLPELSEASGERDVRVRLRVVNRTPSATPELMRFTVEGLARYEIRRGSEIAIDIVPGADLAAVRLFLLGSAMAALLHQRGILALHANAIVRGGAAFAFMGPSGSGKSTLAAWFAANGCAVLSDDVCALMQNGRGGVEVQPGVPRIRLCHDSAAAHDIDTSRAPEVKFKDGWRKHVLTLGSVSEPRSLRAIYVLEREGEGLRQLAQAEGFEVLLRNAYRGELIGAVGDSRAHFEDMLALSRSVPVFRWARSQRLGDWTNNRALLAHLDQLIFSGELPHASL